MCGLMELDATGLSGLRKCDGLIVVANHPCLLDAVLMVSQLPASGLPDVAESGISFSWEQHGWPGISTTNPASVW